jgi:ribonuclease HII
MPDFSLETAARGIVVGVDEAGRGPLAGPVVAAAVVLDRLRLPPELADSIDDSKVLTRPRRESIFAALPACARIGVGVASVSEIDRLNILHAALLAMQRAVTQLAVCADLVLVDGNRLPRLPYPAQAVIGGDGRSLSIAAASIVAKVTRDRMMQEYEARFPGYGFAQHKGYCTADHMAALERLGPSPIHRRSYAPVRALAQMRLV